MKRSSREVVGGRGIRVLSVLTLFVSSMVSAAPSTQDLPSEDNKVPPEATVVSGNGVIRIEVGSSIADAALFSGWIRQRHLELADRWGTPGGLEWLSVNILGATYDYRVSVVAMVGESPVSSTEARLCECNNEELLEQIDVQIAEAVEVLDSHFQDRKRVMVERNRRESEKHVAEPTVETQVHEKRRSRLGQIGGAGVGLAVLGATSLAGGIAFVMWPALETRGPNLDVEEKTLRQPGLFLSVGGGSVLAIGAALIAVGIRSQRRVSVGLSLGTSSGLAVRGSF